MKKLLLALSLLLCGSAALADDYVLIMLDTSGSMGNYMSGSNQQKIKVAQDSLITVLSQAPATTKVGILTFSGWIYPIGPIDNAKITQAVRATRPGGGTPLWEYVRDGVTELLKVRAANRNIGSYKLILVSDGEANGDGSLAPGQSNDVLNDVIRRGITVDAIGIMMGDQVSVAKLINGKYMSGDDPSSLQQALAKAVAEVGFKDQDQLADTFEEVKELPAPFVLSVIKGLTTFANQGVGEPMAQLETAPDGSVIVQQAPVPQPTTQAQAGDTGMSGWCIFWIIVGVIVAIIVIFCVIAALNDGCY